MPLDQKISEIPLVSEIVGAMKIATGQTGMIETGAFTIDMLIAFFTSTFSGIYPIITSGSANPDNANGINGAIYFKTDSSTYLSVYQKASGVWGSAKFTFYPSGSKTTLPIVEDMGVVPDKVINWQTDIVPGDSRTYAQKHGNTISQITGVFEDGSNMTSYLPGWSYTVTGANVNVLTITTLFIGKITII